MPRHLCAIALGGNIGDVPAAFRRAHTALSNAGFLIRRFSSLYITKPVGCEPDAPDFVNAVLSGFWDAAPLDLLARCQQIEAENGRPNLHPRHVSRPLDLDIILFGGERIALPNLVIPHPEAVHRDFVMNPLREIEPELAEWLASGKSSREFPVKQGNGV